MPYDTTKIAEKIDSARLCYYRLVLIVGLPGNRKTTALMELSRKFDYPYLNVNLLLSQKLLEVPSHMRPIEVQAMLEEIVTETSSEVVLLDNIEILFDSELKQNPLRSLQSLSRNRTIVATWMGRYENKELTYAEPGHPEYRRYQDVDVIIVSDAS